MPRHSAQLEDLVILETETASRSVRTLYESADADIIGIIAPAVLAEGIVIQVSHDGVTWATLNDGTDDVAGPTAGKAYEYDSFAYPYWRLLAAGAVAADRTFKCFKIWNTH